MYRWGFFPLRCCILIYTNKYIAQTIRCFEILQWQKVSEYGASNESERRAKVYCLRATVKYPFLSNWFRAAWCTQRSPIFRQYNARLSELGAELIRLDRTSLENPNSNEVRRQTSAKSFNSLLIVKLLTMINELSSHRFRELVRRRMFPNTVISWNSNCLRSAFAALKPSPARNR